MFYNIIFKKEYLIIGFFIILSVLIGSVIIILSFKLAIQDPDFEKISTYECGFQPFEDARNKFDIRFYLVALLFLIFDLEIVYIFP